MVMTARVLTGFFPSHDFVIETSENALKYWGRKRHYSFLPECSADIVAGWMQGCMFSIDRPGSCMPELSSARRAVAKSGTVDLGWGLTSRAFGQHLWLFSHRAFHAAVAALEAWNIGRIVGGPFSVRWINMFGSENSSRPTFVYGPSPVPGFWAYRNGEQTILWHPLILGPAGLWDKGDIRPSLGLAARLDGSNSWLWRGEAVTDGTWKADGFHPLLAPDGWFSEKSIRTKGESRI